MSCCRSSWRTPALWIVRVLSFVLRYAIGALMVVMGALLWATVIAEPWLEDADGR
jgi:hypothetical protein